VIDYATKMQGRGAAVVLKWDWGHLGGCAEVQGRPGQP